MGVIYNLDFDIAAILLLTLEMVYVRIQYAHDKYSNRLFIMLLHSSFMLSIVDIVNSLLLGKYAGMYPGIMVRISANMYFLGNAFLFLAFYRYIVEYLGEKRERTVAYYVRTYFPFLFIVECLVANNYANVFFSSGKYGHFSYGSLILIIYLYPIYYFILTIITLINNRKSITAKQVFSVLSFIIITIISIIVELTFTNVSMLVFGFSISMLIMIFTLETPDYRNLLKATQTLKVVREELDQRDDFNRTLINDFSREVVYPLGKMLDMNESIPNDSIDDKQKEVSAYINGYGRMIRSTINNLLEFNTIGSGNNDFEMHEYSLRDLVNEVRSIVSPLLIDTSNTLNVEIGLNVPDAFWGPDLILKQIMLNFVTNAISNTQEGEIRLTVNCRQMERDALNLVISVYDMGAGMDRETVKKLLHFNTQSQNWKKELFDSGNFKIRISKKLIEDLNGRLSIDSAVGKGSVFTADFAFIPPLPGMSQGDGVCGSKSKSN